MGSGVAARRRTTPAGLKNRWAFTIAARVSQDLSAILDVEPELSAGYDRAYTLEVSSPGLDRPLRGEVDYRRFSGPAGKDRDDASGRRPVALRGAA